MMYQRLGVIPPGNVHDSLSRPPGQPADCSKCCGEEEEERLEGEETAATE